MGRSAGLLVVAMSCAFSMGLVGNPSSTEAGGNCQAKLVGNSYDCNLKISGSSPETFCFEFQTGGISANFDLFSVNDYGCTCDTTGSFKSPSFDSSSSAFECVDDGTQINGKIKSKKLSGQIAVIDGTSAIYTCTLRSSPCP